jgi:hypothetical protein
MLRAFLTITALLLNLPSIRHADADDKADETPNNENQYKSELAVASDFFWKQQGHSSSLLELLRHKPDVKSFNKLIDVMVVLGPVFMIASTGIFFLSLYGDSSLSEESKLIQDGFQRIEEKLALLSSQITEVTFLVSYKAAQTVYQRDANAIYNLFDEITIQTNSNSTNELFLKNYELLYQYAAKNIWRYLVTEDFTNINLLQSYRDYVKCNPFRIQTFAARMIDRINKGQAIEAHYYALKKDWKGLKLTEDQWKVRMAVLQKKLINVVEECDRNWKDYAEMIINDILNSNMDLPNEDLAAKIYYAFNTDIPQRIWGIWVYDNVDNEGEHFISSPSSSTISWARKKKTILAVSFPQDNKPSIQRPFKYLANVLSDIVQNKCTLQITHRAGTSFVGPYTHNPKLANDLVSFITKFLVPKEKNHAIFVVRLSKGVAFHGSPLRVFQSNFSNHCIAFPVKIFIFL